jgi:short subunit dehydrogenase-like uncharacterized protein
VPGRIVLYGATGYIGGLIARAMVAGGARPVLAGRDQGRLDALAERLSRNSVVAGHGRHTPCPAVVAGARGDRVLAGCPGSAA